MLIQAVERATQLQALLNSAAQYEASVAGLLHDIGELVVADRAPAKLCEVLSQVSAGRP